MKYFFFRSILVWIGSMLFLTATISGVDTVRIMPLGDSITRGNDTFVSDEEFDHGYRSYLWYKLNGGGYSVDFVGSLNIG